MSCCDLELRLKKTGQDFTEFYRGEEVAGGYNFNCAWKFTVRNPTIGQPDVELYLWSDNTRWYITQGFPTSGQPSPTVWFFGTLGEIPECPTNNLPTFGYAISEELQGLYELYDVIPYQESACCCIELEYEYCADVCNWDTLQGTIIGEANRKCVWSFDSLGLELFMWYEENVGWWITTSQPDISPRVGTLAGLENQNIDCPINELSAVDWAIFGANITNLATYACPTDEICNVICGQICFSPFV